MTPDEMIDGIIAREGSAYTDTAGDAGGPTKFGVTQRALADWRGKGVTSEDVMNLEESEARAIYREAYINRPGFSFVMAVSQSIGVELADAGVSVGTAKAVEFLTRSLNVMNDNARLYPDLPPNRPTISGDVLVALKAFLAIRGKEGEAVLLKTLECLRGERYVRLAEANLQDEKFVYGWMKNRVNL